MICSNLNWHPDVWPVQVLKRRSGGVPHHHHLVEVGKALQSAQGVHQHLEQENKLTYY